MTSWLRSLVIVTASFMIVYSYHFNIGGGSFPSMDRNNRFTDPLLETDNTTTDSVQSNAAEQNQKFNTEYFEAMTYIVNGSMGIVTMVAGLTENKPLALISAAWMIVFAICQVAIAASFTDVICAENEIPIECVPGSYFSGSRAVAAFCVIYYAVSGILTAFWARQLDGDAGEKLFSRMSLSSLRSSRSRGRKSHPPASVVSSPHVGTGPGASQPPVHAQPIGTGQSVHAVNVGTGHGHGMHSIGTDQSDDTALSSHPIHTYSDSRPIQP